MTDREIIERLKAPLYEAAKKIGFGSRELERLLRDNRGVAIALDSEHKAAERRKRS